MHFTPSYQQIHTPLWKGGRGGTVAARKKKKSVTQFELLIKKFAFVELFSIKKTLMSCFDADIFYQTCLKISRVIFGFLKIAMGA